VETVGKRCGVEKYWIIPPVSIPQKEKKIKKGKTSDEVGTPKGKHIKKKR